MDLEPIIQDIKSNVGAMITKLDDSETKVSKVVDQLEKLEENAKAFDEKQQEIEAQIKSQEDENESLRKALKAIKLDAYRDGSYSGKFQTEKAAELMGRCAMSFLCKEGTPPQVACKGWLDDEGFDAKAMAEGVGTTGGFLVPEELIPSLITLIETYGVFRSDATRVPLGTDVTNWPKLNSDVTVYVPGEGTAITTSDLGIQNVGLTPKKLATLTAVSSELNEDSAIAIGELVGQSIARAFAKAEDQIGLLADGTSTYWGFTGWTGSLRGVHATIGSVKGIFVGTGNAYSEIVDADLLSLMGLVPGYADVAGELKWYCSRLVYYTIHVRLAMAAGGANATELLNLPGGLKAYHGYPVQFAQVLPAATANSQLAVLFGNLRQGAFFGDRRQMTIESSRDVYFANDQIGIRGTERIAGNAHDVGTTSVAGALCALAMKAS